MKRNEILFRATNERGMLMIGEGIAEYLSSLINPENSITSGRLQFDPWVDYMRDEPLSQLRYHAGVKLVTPILQTNFIKGIFLLSSNIPQFSNASDIQNYQNWVLEQLKKGKKAITFK